MSKTSTKSVENLSVGDLFRLPNWSEGEYAKVTDVTFARPYGTPFATVTFTRDRATLPNGRVEVGIVHFDPVGFPAVEVAECVFGTRVTLAA